MEFEKNYRNLAEIAIRTGDFMAFPSFFDFEKHGIRRRCDNIPFALAAEMVLNFFSFTSKSEGGKDFVSLFFLVKNDGLNLLFVHSEMSPEIRGGDFSFLLQRFENIKAMSLTPSEIERFLDEKEINKEKFLDRLFLAIKQ